MTEPVIIYTDGACRGNPGAGGWGAFLQYKGRMQELYGGEQETTNNRMELMAAIRALETLNRSCKVEIYTDSKYVMLGVTEWLSNWKNRGWKTASKKPVKNEDLWRRLDAVISQHQIQWKWVKGHSGNQGNEKADRLANQGIDALLNR